MSTATIIAGGFALGFYAVTTAALLRARRLAGRSPLAVLRDGSIEEVVAAAAMTIFPLVLVLSTLRPDARVFGTFLQVPQLPAAAAILLAGGLLLQTVAMRTLGRALRIGIDPEQRTLLVRGGPYQYIRHPIYAAFLSYYGAAWLLQPNLVFSVVLPLAWFRIVYQALQEERALREIFGQEYEDYMRSTRRFIPGII